MKRWGVARPIGGAQLRGTSLPSGTSGPRTPRAAHLPHPRALHRLALGIERIGLIPLRFPVLAAILVLVLSIGAAFGVARIKVDDSLSQLFRSDTPEFKQYEEVSRRVPPSQFDLRRGVLGR